jgi:hypothetical protein
LTIRLRLTNRVIKDLQPPAGRTEYVHDATVTGFCVAVTPTGARSFYFYGRVEGRPQRIKIGSFPEMNTDQARTAARSIIGDIASGRAVGARKRTNRITLDDAYAHYIATHAKAVKRTWKRWRQISLRAITPRRGGGSI